MVPANTCYYEKCQDFFSLHWLRGSGFTNQHYVSITVKWGHTNLLLSRWSSGKSFSTGCSSNWCRDTFCWAPDSQGHLWPHLTATTGSQWWSCDCSFKLFALFNHRNQPSICNLGLCNRKLWKINLDRSSSAIILKMKFNNNYFCENTKWTDSYHY